MGGGQPASAATPTHILCRSCPQHAGQGDWCHLKGLNHMRTKIAALLTASLLSGACLAVVPVTPATPEQVNRALAEAPAWADDAVELLVSRGIYIGYPDGSFGWQDDITRAEMAMVIARLISSFDLHGFNPDELLILRRAAEQLQADLTVLTHLMEAHDGQLAEAAATLDRHEDELAELWEALGALDLAPEAFDATDLWLAIAELETTAADGNMRLNQLEEQLGAMEADSDTSDLRARLTELETQQAAADAQREQLAADLSDLQARVAELEANDNVADLVMELQMRLDSAAERLALLEARVTATENGLRQADAQLHDHEERIGRLEDSLLPERAAFHISLALYGSAPDGGLVGQVGIGHDSIVGNLGARVSTDFGFSEVPFSLAGALTYRASMDSVDGYAGLGLGASFEETGTAMFAEMFVGVSYRMARNIGIYAEARYRPYFDGSGDALAAIGGGVQLRF